MGKKNQGTMIIGYDLGYSFSQISYCSLAGGEPETISSVVGTEQYSIPTVLCKRRGVNQWFYGKEAVKYAKQEEGLLVENLYSLAVMGEEVTVDNETYDPAALLALFVKRSMSLLSMEVKSGDIAAVMFTVELLNERVVEVLNEVAANLQLPKDRIFFQSYREGIYQYIVHQPKELWANQVLVCDFDDYLKTYLLESNRRTTPIVVFVDVEEIPYIKRPVTSECDALFLEIVRKLCSNGIISTVYLLGDGFKENWTDESIKFLCRGRRVFQGNNLYSKGACYGACEKLQPAEISKTHVFLGEDKLKANIGMKVMRHGIESYFAVLDAGTNWYEARNTCEVILDTGNQMALIITSLTGGVVTEQNIILDNLPERPGRTTRLQMQIRMTSCKNVKVTVADIGFGDLFPSTEKTWDWEFIVS